MNLLGNAIKYTVRGGVILRTRTSTTTEEKNPTPWIAIEVVDTGIGIHPTHHAQIFEEFEQVGAGPRGDSARRGTGLGLAISKRLCEALGGRIELESEPGGGSTFTLWIPAELELAIPAEQALELAEHASRLRG